MISLHFDHFLGDQQVASLSTDGIDFPEHLLQEEVEFPADGLLAGQELVELLEVALEPYKNNCSLVTVNSTLEAFALVLEGKADAAMGVSFENFLIGKHALTGLNLHHIDLEHKNTTATGIRIYGRFLLLQ